MALGDLMNTGYAQSTVVVSNLLSDYSSPDYVDLYRNRDLNEMTSTSGASGSANGGVDGDNVYEKSIITTTMTSDGGGSTSITAVTSMDYFPKTVVFCELRHEAFEDSMPTGPAESGLVFKWRRRDQIKTGMAALVLCLNIGCDPPDVIKIDPCARMECWIDPSSMEPKKAVDAISKALTLQYEGLKSKTRYKYQGDPTVEDVQKLCNTCRKYAKTERVLFHYNGHGVPKPTVNGELWFFNKHYTQYIPVQITELDSWLKSPSIYVFDCSAAGNIFNAFIELIDASASSGATKDCILLAACEAHETLPQSADFPADVFTSCLTTPIQMALKWLCKRSLLRESFIHIVMEKIPGRLNDRKTLLGELNWIFTAVTDTIAWNVLPHDLFQRLFRRDILVASLFRNFLLAERIMRSANCSPITYPMLPPTRQHHMWNAWDMAAEICLSQLPSLTHDPTAKFQPSPFFTEQLRAFELWLDHASEHKKPPEQLPIVLQVLISHSHRSCALGLLGRFLDMGPWAVDLALSAGLFPYVLKLLQTTTPDLLLVFIWTKILALDKSCQVDLVKDEGHKYFIRFLDSPDTCHEQRAMAVFVLAVIVDGHKRGKEACIKAGLVDVCLKHLQALTANDTQSKPLFLQWLCLCLAKIWEDFTEAQLVGLQAGAALILAPLLSESQPEVRASAVFALGILLGAGHDSLVDGGDEDCDDDEWVKADIGIIRNLLSVVPDGSPLVRAEVAVALDHFVFSHKKHLKSVAATYWRSQPGYGLHTPHVTSTGSGYSTSTHYIPSASIIAFQIGPPLRFSGDNNPVRDERVSACSPLASAGILHGSPLSDDSSQLSDSGASVDAAGNGIINHARPRPLDSSLYLECIFSMCTLAKDPSPRIASLGRRILSIIGIEQAVARSIRTSTSGAQPGEPTTSAGVKLSGLARSSSWFDLSSGHLPLTFRTPPVSPPRTSHLMGIRRVSSLDFRPHLLWSPDSGLADPLLGYSGSTGHTERSNLPQSTIYNWSCLYFSKPLLTVSDDSEELISNRETKENSASDLRVKCQHYSVRKLDNQIASWNTNFETGTTTTVLQPFTPVVIAADEKERIRVWNYEEPALLNSFDNHEFPDQRISKLCLLNELDDSLLLAASGDGNVRVWKDYMLRGKQKLITAFSSLPVHGPNVQNVNAVVDWQQKSGYLFVSGEVPSIKVWDLEKEKLVHSIPLSTDNSISALAASHVHEGQFAAGFVDGFVKLFDIRTPEMLVCSTRQHVQERVVGIGFQPGLDVAKIVSASQAGDIQFLDTRNHGNAYRTINSHRGSLTALAVHRHAPIIASGSAKQIIKVFNLDGEQLGFIRYHPTFMAHKIGPVSCLAFHPYQVLLAAGAVDPFVTLYADDNFGR